jgi:Zn-dependent peptidase ImmA (M78 family)
MNITEIEANLIAMEILLPEDKFRELAKRYYRNNSAKITIIYKIFKMI